MNYKIYYTVDVLSMLKGMNSLFYIITVSVHVAVMIHGHKQNL